MAQVPIKCSQSWKKKIAKVQALRLGTNISLALVTLHVSKVVKMKKIVYVRHKELTRQRRSLLSQLERRQITLIKLSWK